ncbi:unnamed protein product (macronuclear) [Paramecium tetraurelia]|uniref:B box-type domain-containing protein n=1 Tax=Paramecium tetraurelia TaxID=5888 RepID=A0BNJ8_PARTE|nr:uncharacterized protein GSPATT00030753001 [Paramecium tetraurelia]CAK60115.1 unnamed protein product [Paramecium tetraurelia]|eukprot:XP_001427513.1 hypothetical protein (macronuclear) [Paramecium tetraurelia strain d4-2]
MSSFQTRVQKLQCEEANHDNKPIILICFNKDCNKRKVCLTCIEEFHKTHKGELASIEDVEGFIRNNCIKQRGAPQCNEIIGKFNELQNDIINQLKVLEFILKEKVRQIFDNLNNTDNKLQQIGDDREDELNDLQNKCKQKIEEFRSEWNNKLNSFKSILVPLQINLNRFEKLSENELELSPSKVNISVLYPKQNIKITKLNISLLEKSFHDKQIELEFSIFKNMNLQDKLHNWKTSVDHNNMKIINGSYQIEIQDNILLKEGECYSLEIKSDQDVKFNISNEQSLENPLIGFQQRDYEKTSFKADQNTTIISQSSSGLLVAIGAMFE